MPYTTNFDDEVSKTSYVSEINNLVSIFDVLEKYNIPLPKGKGNTQQIQCPFHKVPGQLVLEHHPSARVFSDTNQMHCYTCPNGDNQFTVLKFVAKAEKTSIKEAANLIIRVFNLDITNLIDNSHKNAIEDKTGVYFNDLYAMLEETLIRNKGSFDSIIKYYNKFKILDTKMKYYKKRYISTEEADKITKEVL